MKTYALIGPSGSGKSHRAIMVAKELDIDLIIDDGLLIRNSRILAGVSSKSQHTKVGAIKTALFAKDEHAREVKEAIKKENPEKILVLGTSEGMVMRIVSRLELPAPTKILSITDVATPSEISRAYAIRKKHNKHVIPAPTVEVKPKLSGVLSVPLRVILPRKDSRMFQPAYSVEQTVVKPTFNYLGKFYIANTVLQDIIKFSLKKIQSIDKILKTEIISNPEGIKVKAELSIKFVSNIKEIGKLAQKEIKKNIEHMTALYVSEVDIVFKKMVL